MPDTRIDLERARSCTTAPRTLHCANAALYLGMSAMVTMAAFYVLFFRETDVCVASFAVAACLVAWAWGGYYALLRYVVEPTGVRRCLFGKGTRIAWAELTCAELRETRSQEIASAVLHLETPTASLDLGSDLLPLDAVLDLARELGADPATGDGE